MQYNLKELITKTKPQNISQTTWVEYVQSGDRKAHWQMNRDKTMVASIVMPIGILALGDVIKDFLMHPHVPNSTDITLLVGGILCLVLAYSIVTIIDRMEELRKLRKLEEQENLEDTINRLIEKKMEMTINAQEKERRKPES